MKDADKRQSEIIKSEIGDVKVRGTEGVWKGFRSKI